MENSYQMDTDPSVFVYFKLEDVDEYMLAWTTTPWTLPANVAVAVNKDTDYSLVEHDGTGVLAGLPQPFTATRYHSLTIDPATVPDTLVPNGHTASGVIMAAHHRDLPLHGVQFHPESVLTEGGYQMLANWLADCGDAGAPARAAGMSPLMSA